MLNITTEYPIAKGDVELRLASIHGTICTLIDELKYVLPQCSNQLDVLTEKVNGIISSNNSES